MTTQHELDQATQYDCFNIKNIKEGIPPTGGNKFSAWCGSILLKLSGWEIEGNLPQYSKMVLAIAPHTSNWDFFLGLAVLFKLRIKINFLGKHSIFVPGIKQLLESIGGIPVERSTKHGVVSQVVGAFNEKEKMILAVAPEGTRSSIFPWKTGFLAIAHKANVPVVLIGFDFKNKRVRFGPVLLSEGNFEHEMQSVYAYYATIPAKYPNKVIFPK